MVKSGKIGIEPYIQSNIQPSSYDITLHEDMILFNGIEHYVIDSKKSLAENGIETKEWKGSYVLYPKTFILASTNEWITLPDDITARVEGKSSLGRLGLMIHSTAGYIDPGFDGRITLEVYNIGRHAIILYPGMPIGQISFSTMSGKSQHPYGSPNLNSKYQHQTGATNSRYSDNFDKEMC